MFLKRFLFTLWVISLSLFVMSACAPTAENELNPGSPSNTTNETEGNGQLENDGPSLESSSSLQSATGENSEDVIVDVTPMSEEELAGQAAGQSEPGASVADGSSGVQDGQSLPEMQAAYTDNTYKFKVNYPDNFVIRVRSAEDLAQFNPVPAAAFRFINPVTAASDLGDLEPADLEIYVHNLGQTTALDSWLTANGLLPADGSVSPQPFQAANVSGVQLCASTMIAPGCSYFVINNELLYQLIPATLEGEAMINNTFMLMP